MKPNLKVVADPARAELADAIAEVEAAQKAADAASEAVELAQARLRTAKSDHAVAVAALEGGLAPPRRPLAERLEGVRAGSDEYFRITEAHAHEPASAKFTLDDLKRMRQGVVDTEDAAIVARGAVETAEAKARPARSALNRAKDRRTRAVQEVVRPEIGRLMREAQLATEQLIAIRAALNYVADGKLTNEYGNDRRQAYMFLTRLSFPSEQGLRTEDDLTKRDSAIAAWAQFAERITREADAQFPE